MESPTSDTLIHFNYGRVERVQLKRAFPRFLDGEDFVEYNNTGGPRHVPGIHVAINFERLPNIQFSHGFGVWKQEKLSSPELAMIQLMNDVTEEKEWRTYVFDFDVVKKWKQVAISSFNLNSNLWDWCLFELAKKATKHSETTPYVLALDSASRIYKSDHLKATVLFENLTQRTEGRSISPWLYPFIYGGSPIRTDGKVVRLDNVRDCIGGGTVPPKPFWDNDRWSGEERYYSKTSQWLATDVEFSDDSIQIISPINNLHPLKHKPLYAAIEQLISETLPIWNQVLLYKSLQRNGPRIKPQKMRCRTCTDAVDDGCSCTIELNNFAQWSQGFISPGTIDPPEDKNWSAASAMDGLYSNSRKLYNDISLRQGFADRGFQVYVEISSLEVREDGSMSKESSQRLQWSLSGNRNERIVATTLICLRRENIQEESGKMSFRAETKLKNWSDEEPSDDEKGSSSDSPKALFPGTLCPPPYQKLVTIKLPAGRIIIFPNVLQHKFEPLKRDDKSKPGSLQFLAVHLVDPHYLLCSTRHVPPQSVAWWWEAAKLGFVFRKFNIPAEMRRIIADYAIGRGYGHSMQDEESEDDSAEDGNDGDDGDGEDDDGNDGDGEDGDREEDEEVDEEVDEEGDEEVDEEGNEEGDNGDGDLENENNDDGDGDGEPETTERSRFIRDCSPEKPQEERPIRIEAAVRMRKKALDEHRLVLDAVNSLRIYGVTSEHRCWFRNTDITKVPLDHSDPNEAEHPTVNAAIAENGEIVPAPEKGSDDEDYSDEENDDDGDNPAQNSNGSTGDRANQELGAQPVAEEITEQQTTEEEIADEQTAEEQISEQLSNERRSAERSGAEQQLDEEDSYSNEETSDMARNTFEEIGYGDLAESSRTLRRPRSEDLGQFDRIQRRRL